MPIIRLASAPEVGATGALKSVQNARSGAREQTDALKLDADAAARSGVAPPTALNKQDGVGQPLGRQIAIAALRPPGEGGGGRLELSAGQECRRRSCWRCHLVATKATLAEPASWPNERSLAATKWAAFALNLPELVGSAAANYCQLSRSAQLSSTRLGLTRLGFTAIQATAVHLATVRRALVRLADQQNCATFSLASRPTGIQIQASELERLGWIAQANWGAHLGGRFCKRPATLPARDMGGGGT